MNCYSPFNLAKNNLSHKYTNIENKNPNGKKVHR